MSEYNEKLCDEKHGNIKEILEDHENRLNGHSKRIDELETGSARLQTKMENVCDKVTDLINTIKWGLGIFVTVALFVLGYLIKRG